MYFVAVREVVDPGLDDDAEGEQRRAERWGELLDELLDGDRVQFIWQDGYFTRSTQYLHPCLQDTVALVAKARSELFAAYTRAEKRIDLIDRNVAGALHETFRDIFATAAQALRKKDIRITEDD